MHDELNRSMSDLKLESLERPYFIEYTLTISDKFYTNAILGNLTEKYNRKSAVLTVKVRVGSYERDNSNFMDIGSLFQVV